MSFEENTKGSGLLPKISLNTHRPLRQNGLRKMERLSHTPVNPRSIGLDGWGKGYTGPADNYMGEVRGMRVPHQGMWANQSPNQICPPLESSIKLSQVCSSEALNKSKGLNTPVNLRSIGLDSHGWGKGYTGPADNSVGKAVPKPISKGYASPAPGDVSKAIFKPNMPSTRTVNYNMLANYEFQ